MKHIILLTISLLSITAHAEFVPKECTVESWCLVKATDCFVGHYSKLPSTYLKGHSQYSVVRKVQAICKTRSGYGGPRTERRIITGPVEPIKFTGEAFPEQQEARDSALNLCQVYRNDWVSAAPSCNN
jgi:hypothetical protein